MIRVKGVNFSPTKAIILATQKNGFHFTPGWETGHMAFESESSKLLKTKENHRKTKKSMPMTSSLKLDGCLSFGRWENVPSQMAKMKPFSIQLMLRQK